MRLPSSSIVCRALRCAALGCALVAGCGSRAVDATPVSAVRAFLEAMEATDVPARREEAYRLLCPAAQIALAERARTAGALGGRTYEPSEMIVEGRVYVHFVPRRSSAFHEHAGDAPDHRVVEVIDEAGASRSISVHEVDGAFCVDLDVPGVEDDDE